MQHLSDSAGARSVAVQRHRPTSSRRSSATCARTAASSAIAKHNLKVSQRRDRAAARHALHVDQASTLEVDPRRAEPRRHDQPDGQREAASRRSTRSVLGAGEDVQARREAQPRAAREGARTRRQQVVAQRAAAKQSIESRSAQQTALLCSIKGEIARIGRGGAARTPAAAGAARLQARLAPQHASRSSQATTVVGASAVAPQARPSSLRRRSTAASSASRCSSWARRTSGAARSPAASTARVS